MAYYRAPKPDTSATNTYLQKELVKLMVSYQKLEQQAFCEHDWESRIEEDWDGHRTDRHEIWFCKKCKVGDR